MSVVTAAYEAEAVPPPEARTPVDSVQFVREKFVWQVDRWKLSRVAQIPFPGLWRFNVHRPRTYTRSEMKLGLNERLKIRFMAYPNGIHADNQNFLSFRAIYTSTSTSRLKISSRIGVINRAGAEVFVFNSECEMQDKAEMTRANFVPRNLIQQYPDVNTLIDMRTWRLKIFCEVSVTRILPIPRPGPVQDFGQFLESGRHADLTLVVNGVEIPAHKIILCRSSPVFTAMFDVVTEASSNKVTITGVDVQTMRIFLQYLYTGRVENIEGVARALLPLADNYGVESLKSLCEHALYNQVNFQNAPDLLAYADQYSVLKLKTMLLEFVTANASQIVNKQEYREMAFARPQLALEVTMSLANDEYGPSGAKRIRLVGSYK